MNFVNHLTSLPNLLMNKFSSVFLASDSYLESFLSADNFFTKILRIFCQFFYFACKWLMYMIDVIYFYFLQLVGVSADTTIFDSAKSDPTFRLLIDNKEEVTNVIKNFIGIAIILIIVTAIIAIIKLQSQAMKESQGRKTPTGDVLRSMFKSVLLIIITPLIAILGIIASSVMLQGLYRATNLSDAKSLSGRIFNASASAANKYRSYADQGVRIPIKYNFSGDDKDDAIVYAANMVGKNSFPSLDYFNENETFNGDFYDPVFTDELVAKGDYNTGVEAWLNTKYYKYFDRSEDYNPDYALEKHKIMKTHMNEYYAMSDVIGYALDTIEPYYFVTIQEMLNSLKHDEELLKRVISGHSIFPLDYNGTAITDPGDAAEKIIDNTYQFIQYTSKYEDGSHTYVHIKDALDEMEGAKFTIAYKKSDKTSTYTPTLYGDYALVDGNYKEVEKFYYRESDQSRFKKVDLYYELNPHNGRYEKAEEFNAAATYYYRIGEDYILIDETNQDKFYYRLKDGTYKSYTLGSMDTFYVVTKIEYFLPLVSGVSPDTDKYPTFRSEYIETGNIITARGVFDEAGYPTAIRRINNGNIMFYRDDLEVVTDGSISDVGKLEEIEAEEEEDTENKGFLGKVGGAIKSAWNSVKKFVASIFNPLKLVPDLNIDESKMASTYTNKTKSVTELEDGKLHISYMFADSVTSRLTKNMYAINLNNLFEPLSMNYIVLVFASVVLFKVILTAIFGLINRALSLFMLILIYPLACSTIPLDAISGTGKGGSYSKWSDRYTRLLFSTFGLLLGINFVFIIIPVIDKIKFFTPENLQNNKALARIANALWNPLQLIGFDQLLASMGIVLKHREPNFHLICEFINKILQIIFQITAFSLVTSTSGKGGPDGNFFSVIQHIVKPGPDGVLEDSPLDAVKKMLKTMASTVNMIFFPGRAAKNMIEKSKESVAPVKKFLKEGSAIKQEAMKKMSSINQKAAQDDARKALLKALREGAPKSEVEDKLKTFKSTHNTK